MAIRPRESGTSTSDNIPNYSSLRYLTFPYAAASLPTGNRNNATGIPLEVNQANILLPLAPRLSARSDTFRIRAYGEVRDADDKIIAQATCEAVVQRLPEYVDPDTITIRGMMIPRPLRSTPSTRPTAESLKFRASDGWIKAKYNFTFMTLLRPTLLLACLSVLLSASLTCAQESAESSDSGEAKPYTGKAFTAIALSEIPYENLYYRNGTKFIEITWKNGRRSDPYPLSEAKSLELFIDHDDPKKPYLLVGKACTRCWHKKNALFRRPKRLRQRRPAPAKVIRYR